jgi:PBP1b-binding outer membrane lipoprotein LpoB
MSNSVTTNPKNSTDWEVLLAIVLALIFLLSSCSQKAYNPVILKEGVFVTFTDINTNSEMTLTCDSARHDDGFVRLFTNGLEQRIQAAPGVIINITKYNKP